jgi:hypothetical protein
MAEATAGRIGIAMYLRVALEGHPRTALQLAEPVTTREGGARLNLRSFCSEQQGQPLGGVAVGAGNGVGSADANAHSEEGDNRSVVDLECQPSDPGQCRPRTGAASQNCHPPTGVTMSIMNRARTATDNAGYLRTGIRRDRRAPRTRRLAGWAAALPLATNHPPCSPPPTCAAGRSNGFGRHRPGSMAVALVDQLLVERGGE